LCLQAAQRHKERKEKINLAAAVICCRTQRSNTQAEQWHNERKRSKDANCEEAQGKNNNNQIGSGWWRCINNQPGSSGAVTINLAAMAFVVCKLCSSTRGENINNNKSGCCVVALLHMMQQHASCTNDDRNAQIVQGHKGGIKRSIWWRWHCVATSDAATRKVRSGTKGK